VHRENEDFSVRVSFSDLPRRLDSIQERERVVDDGDVRLCLQSLLDSLPPIGGLGNNFPTGMRFEDGPQSAMRIRVMINRRATISIAAERMLGRNSRVELAQQDSSKRVTFE
jgi:hypothetical protein